jgi:broad specificity phosphatase PhoE
MTCRMNLIVHGATKGMRHAGFPGDDELDADLPITGIHGSFSRTAASRAQTSPARRARQSAEALGLQCSVEEALGDLDYGAWAGRPLEQVQREDPAGLALWRTDPEAAPHGGESIAHLLERVAHWLDREAKLGGRIVAVTHSAVIRVAVVHAIGAPLSSFWHLDAGPLTASDLRHDGRRWTVRTLGQAIARTPDLEA